MCTAVSVMFVTLVIEELLYSIPSNCCVPYWFKSLLLEPWKRVVLFQVSMLCTQHRQEQGHIQCDSFRRYFKHLLENNF
jgi:hypothetical protein